MIKMSLVCMLVAASFGCSGKVDCAKMTAKMNECGVVLVKKVLAGQFTPEQLASVPDSQVQSLMGTMVGQLKTTCEKDDGKFADAKEMNGCLAKATCDEFATCIAAYVK